jgi:hypothetical protein
MFSVPDALASLLLDLSPARRDPAS